MSTVITPFQGTDSFSTATFNNRISQINTGFSYISNPNLLDNWYFGNPINQRGQTSYTGSGYTIDRWIRYGGNTLLNDGYITLLGYNNNLDQSSDKDVYKQLRGKTVTMSVLGRGYFSIVAEDYENSYNVKYVNSGEFTIGSLALTVRSDADRFIFHIQPQDGNPCDIIAVKLELGSQQTLAHQDENGNWQLNEIPDYGEQLARCQRYFQRIVVPVSTSFIPIKDNSIIYQCNLPVQMRAEPSVTCGTFFIVNRNNDSAVFSENFVTPIKQSASVNSVIISIEKTQSNPVPAGKSGGAYVGSYYDNPGTRIIDCTADL